jgi:iron-sulfur cluster repair protein YtfE (RIC family)
MAVIEPTMKVGDIARIWPQTMQVFARYRLDLCCGGVHPLEFAAQKHGFNLERIVQELNAAVAAPSVAAENQ